MDDARDVEKEEPPLLLFTALFPSSGRVILAEGWRRQSLSATEAQRRVCDRLFIMHLVENDVITTDMCCSARPQTPRPVEKTLQLKFMNTIPFKIMLFDRLTLRRLIIRLFIMYDLHSFVPSYYDNK